MARIELTFLGRFQARLKPGPLLNVHTRKAQALLAYLALPPGLAHPRDKVAALLWGDMRERQARTNLRQTLFTLRRALPVTDPDSLRMEGAHLALDPAAVDVDVATFEGLVSQGTPEALAQAVAIYQGDLLEGLAVQEAPFEDWLMAERERLREMALEALARLLAHQSKSQATERAIQTAIRLVALDPLQEPAHRTLMRLFARQGRRSAALKQYQVCVGVLRRELGADPEPETRRLYQDILQQRVSEPAKPEAPRARKTPRTRPPGPVGEGPLIGREAELEQLRVAFEEVRSGLGRVVAIVGEAGVGKSSLVTVGGADAREQGARLLLGRCYESQQVLPFGPWVDAFRGDGVSQEAETLQELAPVWRAELSRLLPEVTAPDLPAPSDDLLRLFESVAQLVERLTLQGPLALVLEDLHWADEMSLRLFAFVARRMRTVPALIVATAREEELPGSPFLRVLDEVVTEPHFVRMSLFPLSRGETAALVRSLARRGSDEALVARLSERLWAASAGNPFIIVETMRALDEGAATETAPNLLLPERVRQVIAGRLERLSQRGQQLAAVAAVIGREFEFPVLQVAAGLGVREAADGVEELVRRRVLHGSGERLDFTHERVRAVVYGRLPTFQLTLLHGLVAKALEEVFAENLEPHYAALALHYRESETWGKAATYLRRAGIKAAERSAYREAATCFEQALTALEHLPATSETLAQAIDLRFDLRAALLPRGDLSRIFEHLRSAEQLAEKLGDSRRLGWVSVLLSQLAWGKGQPTKAFTLAQRALTIAETLGDVHLGALANQYLGTACLSAGDYRKAAEFFLKTIEILGGARSSERVAQTGYPAVLSRSYLSMALAELGDFDDGIVHGQDGIRLAETLDHPFSLIQALRGLGYLYNIKGDLADAARVLERGISLCSEWNVTVTAPILMTTLAFVYSQMGRGGEGVPLLEQALGTLEARGLTSHHSLGVLRLGEACLLAGRSVEARALAERAQMLTREYGERGYEAWALRLTGEARSQEDQLDVETADRHYRQALALGQGQEMRPLVAHCHLGLGKLYRRTAERQQAQDHLTTATTMYREMGMTNWLEKAEAELR